MITYSSSAPSGVGGECEIPQRLLKSRHPVRVNWIVNLSQDVQEGSPLYGQVDYRPLVYMLRAMMMIDYWHHATKSLPALYSSGVYYEEEPPGVEEWLDTIELYRRRKGDCEDLNTSRSGELRAGKGKILRGGIYVDQRHPIMARPCIKWAPRHDGGVLIHVMTLFPDGQIEDPSRILGMGSAHPKYRISSMPGQIIAPAE